MRRIKLYWPLLVATLVVLFFGSMVLASAATLPVTPNEATANAAPEGTNFQIEWDAIGSGAATMTSTSYTLTATVGQPAIGEMTSDNYRLGSGYWYQFLEWLSFLPLTLRAET